MKKVVFVALLMSLLVSCAVDGYRIEGEAKGVADGVKVYMALLDESFTYVDSTVVNDGRFVFEGRQDTPVVRMIMPDAGALGGPVVLENGKVSVVVDGGLRRSGTPLNDNLQRYFDERDRLSAQLAAVTRYLDAASLPAEEAGDSLAVVVAAAKKRFVDVMQNVIGANMDNASGVFMLTLSREFFTPEEMYVMMSAVPQHLRDAHFEDVYEQVVVDKEAKGRAWATGVGCPYINFELPDISGDSVLFSDIVSSHKYTLLDFWASWCLPCRGEMPAIRQIYDDFSSRGLAVVSLSLDSSQEEWRDGVSSLGMKWIQLCSPSGGSAEVAAAYGVESIPMLILIDSNGNIVMRGEPAIEVARKLGELLR